MQYAGRLQVFASMSAEKISAQDTRALPVLILIVALFCEHCNFDQLLTDASPATEDSLPDIRRELGSMTQVFFTFPPSPRPHAHT